MTPTPANNIDKSLWTLWRVTLLAPSGIGTHAFELLAPTESIAVDRALHIRPEWSHVRTERRPRNV